MLVAEMCAGWKKNLPDKHCLLETGRELEVNTQKRICASRWSVTKNHYMMHGQQSVK
jgi:hypothetical protein